MTEVESKEERPEAGLLAVAERFQASLEAVGELSAFAAEHARQLDDELTAIGDIVSKRLPNVTPEQHRAGAAVVRDAMEELGRTAIAYHEEHPDSGDEERRAAIFPILDAAADQLKHISESPTAFAHYVTAAAEARARPQRLPVLQASLLTTAVSSFEVLVSGLVREFLRLRPEALRGDDAKYSLSEIEGFRDLGEFREHCADRYAENLLRGSFEDWVAWFEKRVRVTLDDIADDKNGIREVFQRRHLFVHNGGQVNRLYLLKLSDLSAPPELGTVLAVDDEYLAEALDQLLTAGLLLVAFVTRKLIRPGGAEAADSLINNASFELLQNGRYAATTCLTSRMIEECSDDYLRLVMQVNSWIAKKRMYGVGGIRDEVSFWQTSSLRPRFELAKLSLLDQTEEAHALGRRLLEQGEISEDDWNTWPLLAEVRAYGLEPELQEPTARDLT